MNSVLHCKGHRLFVFGFNNNEVHKVSFVMCTVYVFYTIGTSVFQNAAKATLVRVAISPVLPAPLVLCVVVNVFQSAVEKIATMSVDVQTIK